MPPVEIDLRGPAEVDVDSEIELTVVVTNHGERPLAELALRPQLDPAMKLEGEAAPLDLPNLPPAASQQASFKVRASESGNFTPTVELVHAGRVLASDWWGVRVRGEEPAEPDLGPPLVDGAESLERLDPRDPVWFDKAGRRVIMLSQVCQREAPLETFACLRGSKEHESVLSVPVKAHVVHAGLLAAGAEPGNPVRFQPDYAPAQGPEIEVTVIWKDESGQVRRARGQEWVRNLKTDKEARVPLGLCRKQICRGGRG